MNPNLKLILPPPHEASFAKFMYFEISSLSSSLPLSVRCQHIGLNYVYGVRHHCRTKSGAFTDGDLLVNRDGVRIVSHNEDETVRNF